MLARTRAPGLPDDKRPYTDGVITGFGTVDGRKVCIFSQDFTVNGGSLGEVFGEKVHKIMDLATSLGVPMVGINDGGGARVQEGVVGLHYFGGHLQAQRRRVRRGPPDQRHHGLLRRRGRVQPGHDRLHLHGARHVADVHHRARRGQDRHRRGGDPRTARRRPHPRHQVRGGRLRHRRREELPRRGPLPPRLPARPTTWRSRPASIPATTPSAWSPRSGQLIPPSPNQPYDMKKVIAAVVDDGEFFEYHALWAMNLVCGFARIDGHVVGIVGNQPQVLAGVLDIESSEKGRPLRAHLRLFQHPPGDVRRRPRVHAGHRPGVRRHHPPRGQAPVRLLRVHRAAHPDHHPQGLRRAPTWS